MSLIGESKRAILLFVAEHEESYGYELAEELSVQLPAVYEHLSDLEDEGVLQSRESGRRRVYTLTEDGKKLVEVLS